MLYRSRPPRVSSPCQPKVHVKLFGALLFVVALFGAARDVRAQTLMRELKVAGASPEIFVRNDSGRVTIVAEGEERKSVSLSAESPGASVGESDVQTRGEGGRIEVSVRQRGERD